MTIKRVKNKSKTSQKMIFLDYLSKDGVEPTSDSMLPKEGWNRIEEKTEVIVLRITPSEKRFLKFFAQKRKKTLTDLLVNGALLIATLNKYGITSALQVLRAVRFMKILKKKAGEDAMKDIASESDLTLGRDDELNEHLWV